MLDDLIIDIPESDKEKILSLFYRLYIEYNKKYQLQDLNIFFTDASKVTYNYIMGSSFNLPGTPPFRSVLYLNLTKNTLHKAIEIIKPETNTGIKFKIL